MAAQKVVVHGKGTEPFDPGHALEQLQHDVVRVEALVGAAFRQLGETPTRGDNERRENERAYALMSAAADAATEALNLGIEMVRQLGDHLASQRATITKSRSSSQGKRRTTT